MKFLKSKIFIGLIVLSFFTAGANVYAINNLDRNILDLIRSGIVNVSKHFEDEAKNEIKVVTSKQKENISVYIDERTGQVISELDKAKDDEVKRAETELNAYYNSLVNETNSVATEETKKGRETIKNSVNTEIEKAKADISSEFEKELRKKLNQLPGNNGNNGNNGNGNGNNGNGNGN